MSHFKIQYSRRNLGHRRILPWAVTVVTSPSRVDVRCSLPQCVVRTASVRIELSKQSARFTCDLAPTAELELAAAAGAALRATCDSTTPLFRASVRHYGPVVLVRELGTVGGIRVSGLKYGEDHHKRARVGDSVALLPGQTEVELGDTLMSASWHCRAVEVRESSLLACGAMTTASLVEDSLNTWSANGVWHLLCGVSPERCEAAAHHAHCKFKSGEWVILDAAELPAENLSDEAVFAAVERARGGTLFVRNAEKLSLRASDLMVESAARTARAADHLTVVGYTSLATGLLPAGKTATGVYGLLQLNAALL